MSKQYILICSEEAVKTLDSVLKGLEFLEVQGMNLNGENKLNLLVTPVIPPVNPAFIAPPVVQPEEISVPV